MGMDMGLVPIEADAIRDYLDHAIMFWREQRDDMNDEDAKHYIDAYQSVRSSLFGEILPPKAT